MRRPTFRPARDNHLMRPPAILLLTNHQHTHTLHQRTATGPRRTMRPKEHHSADTTSDDHHLDLRGKVRRDGMQLNCSPPTTPDTNTTQDCEFLGISPDQVEAWAHVKLPLA